MAKTKHGWTILDEERGVLTYEYSFAPGATANAFAARMKDGTMLVVSPPSRVDAGVFDDVAAYGEVSAIASNNGFHHLGLADWKERFPSARLFADELAAKRIVAKNKKAPDLEAAAGLQELLGDDVGVTHLPNTKCGESWAWARAGEGFVWYTSDVLSNMPKLPDNFFVRTMFKLTGTKPGFGVFHTALKFIVKDKQAVLQQLAAEMAERPPTCIVPGHGPMIEEAGLAQRAQGVIAEAL